MPGVVRLPSLHYQLLAARFEDTSFDVASPPCLYSAVDGRRRLVVFPPGTTFDTASHTLTIGGEIGGSGSADSALDVSGGEMPVASITEQKLAFDPLGCEHDDRVFFVTGIVAE